MSQRPSKFDGEKRQTDSLAPENHNTEQQDSNAQAQTVAKQALKGKNSEPAMSDSEKPEGGVDTVDTPDLVDHMSQMKKTGKIDMSAFSGEPNQDDDEGKYD